MYLYTVQVIFFNVQVFEIYPGDFHDRFLRDECRLEILGPVPQSSVARQTFIQTGQLSARSGKQIILEFKTAKYVK